MLLWALAFASDDATILARIAAARPVAESIVIDGDMSDWAGLYGMRQNELVQEVAIAPTATALAVRVQLAPGVDPLLPLFLGVDSAGSHHTDLSLRVNGSTVFVSYLTSRRWAPLNGASAVRTASGLELQVPWTSLIDAAPPDHELRTEGPRDWVRVRAMIEKTGPIRPVPLAVASYRLTEPPPSLDAPVKLPETTRVAGMLPVQGTWYVGQGGQEGATHSKSWAYDLAVRDAGHRSRSGHGAASEAHAWGQELYSPLRGTVVSVETEQPDHNEGDAPEEPWVANRLVLDLDNRTRLRLGHLQQGSVTLQVGDRVGQGQVVGKVGNSGKSSGPHVHVVYTGADGVPAPVWLSNVRVGLNPSADDPWTRTPERWEPRSGWFVTGPSWSTVP